MNTQPSSSDFPPPGLPEPRRAEKLSDLLALLAARSGDRISIRDLAEALEDRSFGAFLLVFSLPNLIPLPPGATLILGLPMVVVAWQMLAGYQKVWLPRQLADYSMEKSRFQAMVTRVNPWLKRAEDWVRPRNWPITSPWRERAFGLFALIVSLVCVIPIPFGNWPPAFAVAVLGVAHTERDGNFLAAGLVIGLVSIIVGCLMLLAMGALVIRIF